MAKFSVGGEEDDGEGPSSPKRRREGGEEDERKVRRCTRYPHRDSVGISKDGPGISVTLIDPEVLDCPICLEPLTPPVFQCNNGHIACSSCSSKLEDKCPSCCRPIQQNRCLAIEKVVESIKVSCQNAPYGCKEMISYVEKHTHEETCIYAPCACPLSDCNFHGSFEQLSLHVSHVHWDSVRCFRYNCPFPVSLDKNRQLLVFQGEEDGVLFILNNKTELIGNALSVTCIGPRSPKEGFLYDLISRREGCSLRLQSFTKCTTGQLEGSIVDFLLIPCNFCGCNGQIKLEVCIWSCREQD
ncbi:PREDICTED: E3 ubiquitin-protein ligase SINA-like 10 [Nelumbo nucifera]|uniref:RING-type E3 ubiquitin transferase n=1 Tax=Nelumbo nucifera TaxID=4432 RepID=A0A1U7Z9K8_NELNU|nr:PREDICTED: E3 ubiquitin-protein ligase SINA-like 10 [Nelumbo nucifera]